MAYSPAAQVRNNLDATTDPTINDDSTLNYDENSVWLNVSTDKVFYCADPTAGAAVWLSLSETPSGPVSSAMLTKSTKQTGINGSATLTWDGTGFDVNGIADLPNDAIKADADGIWIVTCNVRLENVGGNDFSRLIPRVNGANPTDVGGLVSWNLSIKNFSTAGALGSGIFRLATDDLFTVEVSSDDTNYDVFDSGNGSHLSAAYLGADA